MSLRTRLFIIISGLVFLLLAAQWWMFRMLTDDLDREAGIIAFTVGKDLTRVFADKQGLVEVDTMAHLTAESNVDQDVAQTVEATSSEPQPGHVFIKRVQRTQNGRTTVKTIERKLGGDPLVELDWKPDPNAEAVSQDFRYQFEISGDADFNLEEEVIHMTLDDASDAKNLVLKGSSSVHSIPIPTTGIDRSIEDMGRRLFLGSMFLLFLGLLCAAAVAQHVSSPLRQLAGTAQLLGSGQLGVQAPNPNPHGELGRTISAFNQMSAQLKQLDASERRSRERAHFSELGEIARGLAHTIRNPLNTLGLSMEQMAALNADRAQSAELAEIARQQIRRIDQWIRSFLALAGREAAQVEPLDLTALAQDIALEALQIGGAPVDLQIEGEPPLFPGVAPELRAVFQALIVNAVEASPVDRPVTVVLSGDENQIQLLVEDEGPGLAEEVRQKLFTPHVTTKEQGSGMGLFLAQRMVHSRYGGTIAVTNRSEGGARAEVCLPLNWEVRND